MTFDQWLNNNYFLHKQLYRRCYDKTNKGYTIDELKTKFDKISKQTA